MVQAQATDSIDLAGAEDLVVEPAHVAWHRRLDRLRGARASDLADGAAALLFTELAADHVALWRCDGDAFVVLGADGLSAGARRMRLPIDYPVVNVARGTGGRLRRDADNHHGPRAPGLPGSSSKAYGMLLLEIDAPVDLVTVSARTLGDELLDEIQALLERLDWPTRPAGTSA